MNQEYERQFIEVENLNGEIEKVEIFAQIKSKKDDKVYVFVTPDEDIKEEVNVTIGYVYEENGKYNLQLVEDEEELNYVINLLNEAVEEEKNEI